MAFSISTYFRKLLLLVGDKDNKSGLSVLLSRIEPDMVPVRCLMHYSFFAEKQDLA